MNISEKHWTYIIAATLVIFLAIGSLLLASSSLLQRLDHVLYDVMLPLQSPDISDQIVIINIDDNSLQQLGRWPWSRKIHAQLIDKLTEFEPRAIGIDILFVEPQQDDPDADTALAQAIATNQRTVLIVAPAQRQEQEIITELMPLPELASSAASLAHVDVELDIDGLCRRSYLYAGISNANWRSFSLALLEIGGEKFIPDQQAEKMRANTGDAWVRSHEIMIPFARPGTHPQSYSYADVLAGRIPASAFRDKYILVGATAAGLGDAISTPGAFSHERMPGVELNAHILNGLLQNQEIYTLAAGKQTAISLLLIIFSVALVLWLPLRQGPAVTVTALVITLATSAIILMNWQLWFAPTVTLLMITVAWPLWNIWQLGVDNRIKHRLMRHIEHQSHYHFLTGLPNQTMLQERLKDQTNTEKQDSQLTCLIIIHLDWHDSSSAILGTPAGEEILNMMASNLRQHVDEKHFVAHLNSDDFAVIMHDIADTEIIENLASALMKQLQQPITFDHEKYMATPQLGVSIWPDDAYDAATLLRNAYTAVFKARLDDSQPLCIYSADIGQELRVRSQLERALVSALENNEFELYYQPQVDTITGRVIGLEALLRWNNPKLGWIRPDNFIPVAEHVGLIKTIGNWVLETACWQMKLWHEAGFTPLRIAVNVSPLQFRVSDLNLCLKSLVTRIGFLPSDLEIEITESSLMHDIKATVETMSQIREQGIKLALDDFGTGYSSLSNLHHFPLDALKIDKSFTQEVEKNEDATEIALSIINIGKRLGLSIVAEGVETEQQAEFMRQHGCDEIQGYLYSRPVPADEVPEILEKEFNR